MTERNVVICGDCLEVMRGMDDNSVDAIVTDPPYGLSFMGKDWDHGIPGIPFWQEALRVCKPGAHMLAFGGTRTHHRLMVAIEDAGWEIRDCLNWLYGSGFPKNKDVSKAIDLHLGGEREVVGPNIMRHGGGTGSLHGGGIKAQSGNITAPATPEAQQWSGWGTALKPAWEPIVLARKPLQGTVAENVLRWGTGGINVDGCRIEYQSVTDQEISEGKNQHTLYKNPNSNRDSYSGCFPPRENYDGSKGRWPANLLLDEEAAAMLDAQSGELTSGALKPYLEKSKAEYKQFHSKERFVNKAADSGGASRFFYTAKATSGERNKHLTGLTGQKCNDGRDTPIDNPFQRGETLRKNAHPTVKPVDLLRYLCRLITPPGGLVLDPFAGSGSTGVAAFEEGFDYLLIEIDPEYFEIAKIRNAQKRIGEFSTQPVKIQNEVN